jgi:uncharacterized protein (DUF58 family)
LIRKRARDHQSNRQIAKSPNRQIAKSPPPVETTALPLFDSAFLAKLEQLYLLSKKLFRGAHRAERRSRQTGSSLEFADYRNYTAGDDLRSIDWNIYGRLDRLFIKLFEHEQDLDISFLIDASASMRWLPNTQHSTLSTQLSKLDQVRRITASLAYIGLANLDRVNVHWFASQLDKDMGLARGKSQFHKVLDFLRDAPALEGETHLLRTVRAFTQRMKRRGLVFLLSDLFDPAGIEEALALLRFQRFEVHIIHILDPAELRPTATGDLRLVESESGTACEVTANEALLLRYHAEIDAFLTATATHCAERGIAYGQATTAVPFEDLVLRVLRDGRMVQ